MLGGLNMVRHLVDLGTPINIQNTKDGWTPLHYAAAKGHLKIIRFLISRGNVKNYFYMFDGFCFSHSLLLSSWSILWVLRVKLHPVVGCLCSLARRLSHHLIAAVLRLSVQDTAIL